MRKSIILGLSLLFAFLTVNEAFADSSCKTRNRCRWWRKRYVAKAKVGCWEISRIIPLCYSRQSSCGGVAVTCGPKFCLWGSATAFATNGPGGCTTGGARSGLGWYGTAPESPLPGLERAQGDHELRSRVEFDNDRKNIDIIFDSLTMTATVDEAYSRVDLWVYLEPDTQTKEEPEPTTENTVWYGYLVSQNGQLTQEGFDDLARQFTNNGEITSLEITNFVKTIPFFGSTKDFDNLAVKVTVDGGIPEEGEPSPGPAP